VESNNAADKYYQGEEQIEKKLEQLEPVG